MTAAAQQGVGGGTEWRGAELQLGGGPPQPRDVQQVLHSARAEMAGISGNARVAGGRADAEAGSLGLSRLLNGNLNQFARQSHRDALGAATGSRHMHH